MKKISDQPAVFEVDSPVSIQEAIGKRYCNLRVSVGAKLLGYFFKNIDKKILTHLSITIEPRTFPAYNFNLTDIVKNGSLEYLHVELKDVYGNEAESLIENFRFCSSLKTLEITINDGTQENINKLCREIIALNQETKKFLTEEFPKIKQQLSELNITGDIDPNNLDDQQIELALEMVNQSDYFNKLSEFHKGLNQDSTFKLIQKLADNWDIKDIVYRDDIVKINKVLKSSGFDINRRYSIDEGRFSRLIDMAVDQKSVKIIKILISSNADLTRAYTSETIPYSSYNYDSLDRERELENFPFTKAINSAKEIRILFLEQENALYDGLAQFIYSDNPAFSSIISEVTIDVNKVISDGMFKGFTLGQLMIYYRRIGLIIALNPEQLIKLSKSYYPDKQSFEYSGWSVLAVVVHQGQDNDLGFLFPQPVNLDQINLKNTKNYNAIQLLLDGASETSLIKSVGSEENELKKYKNCLDYLQEGKTIDVEMQELMLYDSANEAELPLLHFAICNKIFSVIEEFVAPSITTEALQKKVYIKNFDVEVNLLELATIKYRYPDEYGEDTEAIGVLFDWYKNKMLLNEANNALPDNINLFQYSILSRNYVLFKKFVEWDDCPIINTTFPENYPKYPGWLPLHVIILEQFPYSDFLGELLTRSDLNIEMPFPKNGVEHHLAGYYPTSALFLPYEPIKNRDAAPPRTMSNPRFINIFLPLIQNVMEDNKLLILNQALFFAIIHHDVTTRHDYRECIKILVENGANLYQTYGNDGDRIIDLAREKGLLHCFPSYLNERNVTLSKQVVNRINRRQSELQQFTIPRRALNIYERGDSVVSLVRNNKSTSSEHVFIVIEQVVDGRAITHFADFVRSRENAEYGDVRYRKEEGKINEGLLLRKAKFMQIDNVDDLSCRPPWQIPNEACNKLLEDIQADIKKQQIKYVLVGNRSVFAQASKKIGHNCYTWAREKLLKTEDVSMVDELKPTVIEFLATLPSTKDTLWYRNKVLLFSGSLLLMGVAGSALATAITSLNNEESNDGSTIIPKIKF